jgi:DNA-binding beta-propeller fold protein YncE
VVEVVGRAGGALGQFANPWAITLDSKGNLYVADSQNHRVQKLVRR